MTEKWKGRDFTNWWCDEGFFQNELRFKMFCKKSDERCFVLDVKENKEIEFNGAKAQGMRIAREIIEKEMRTKRKHKQV